MTKEQINILIKDGDMTPENVKVVYDFSKNPPVLSERRSVFCAGQRFEISEGLEKVLNQIFETYLEVNVLFPHSHYQEKIEFMINDLDNEDQTLFIKNEIQEVLRIKQKLISNYKFARSIEEIKYNWIDKMDLKMEQIIECIKFKIFKGGEIESLIKRKRIHDYPFLNDYFLSPPELEEIIKIVTIEKNIEFLQSKIVSKEIDCLINSIKSTELSVSQIALIHFYENKQITRENGKKIAINYGYTSGEKLFQKFTHYSKTSNRTERPTPCTQRKLKNKIELFESISVHLTLIARNRLNDELLILKSHYKTEYE